MSASPTSPCPVCGTLLDTQATLTTIGAVDGFSGIEVPLLPEATSAHLAAHGQSATSDNPSEE